MLKSIEFWLHQLPPELQHKFMQIRQMILGIHPAIEEKFTYQVPFYHLNGLLFYFAFQKKKQRALIGFCDGFLHSDPNKLLRADEGQTQVKHLYIHNEMPDSEILYSYFVEAVELKLRSKKQK